ncbi:MAG: hypothetical protein IT445_11695 [Phycisphaeraceae bacterium]|nr:hypothetical protein [Phycisphaeraceae bacterium]
MPIRFHCESCEARVKVPAGSEGRRVKCPRCGHLQRVPRHSEQLVTVGAGSSDPSGDSAMGQDSGSFQAVQTEPPVEQTSSKKKKIELGDSLSDLAMDFEKDMTPPQMQRDEPPADEREPEVEQTAEQSEQMSLLEQPELEEQPLPQVESHQIAATAAATAPQLEQSSVAEAGSLAVTSPAPAEEPATPLIQTTVAAPATQLPPAPPPPIMLSGSASRATVKVSEPAVEPVAVTAVAAVAATQEPESSRPLRPARHVKPYTALKNLATLLRVAPAVLIPVVLWHVLQTVTVSGAIVTLISGAAMVAMTWTLAEIADAVRDLARRA